MYSFQSCSFLIAHMNRSTMFYVEYKIKVGCVYAYTRIYLDLLTEAFWAKQAAKLGKNKNTKKQYANYLVDSLHQHLL